MKKLILVAFCAIMISPMYGQLSTRENSETNVDIGARPVAGDMSLLFGLNLTGNDTASFNSDNTLANGNILTFKYYKTDDVVYRLGFRIAKNSKSSSGDVDSSAFSPGTLIASNEFKNSTRTYVLVPGIEKHFAKNNIFDVYVGADLYMGFGRNVITNNVEQRTGDFNNRKAVTGFTQIGIGGVVGFNVFIAELPISIGLEYGQNLLWTLGNKTKVEQDIRVGATSNSIEYYTQNFDPFGLADPNLYSDLKKKDFAADTNQDVRITLNIYFSRFSKN